MRLTAGLIGQVMDAGRARGLSAADIAARAGILPANLSRVRKTGRFNADTLERLLAAVDGEVRLTVRPRKAVRTLSIVTRKLNAGRRERISAGELRRHLVRFRRSAAAERALSHLVGVVEELPIEQVHNLVLEGDATFGSLKRLARFVDGEGPTVDWINAQAGT